MRRLRYLNTILTVIAVLLTLNLWTMWAASGSPDGSAPARAEGLANAAAQRQQIVDQVRTQNQKMDQLIALLKSGQMRVRIEAGK